MTTKRTHGPCSCYPPPAGGFKHEASCPSLYPAQQEPDALTRLARFLRSRVGQVLRDDETEQALSVIAEARQEQKRAVERAEKAERAVSHAASIIEAAVEKMP